MRKRKTVGEWIFDVCNVAFMLLLMVICAYPFLYVVFASFSDPGELMLHNGLLLKPLGFNLDAYTQVLHNKMVAVTYKNTLFYLVVGTCISMILTIFGAFVLSRKKVYIKTALNIMVVITMFFSGGLIHSRALRLLIWLSEVIICWIPFGRFCYRERLAPGI